MLIIVVDGNDGSVVVMDDGAVVIDDNGLWLR